MKNYGKGPLSLLWVGIYACRYDSSLTRTSQHQLSNSNSNNFKKLFNFFNLVFTLKASNHSATNLLVNVIVNLILVPLQSPWPSPHICSICFIMSLYQLNGVELFLWKEGGGWARTFRGVLLLCFVYVSFCICICVFFCISDKCNSWVTRRNHLPFTP